MTGFWTHFSTEWAFGETYENHAMFQNEFCKKKGPWRLDGGLQCHISDAQNLFFLVIKCIQKINGRLPKFWWDDPNFSSPLPGRSSQFAVQGSWCSWCSWGPSRIPMNIARISIKWADFPPFSDFSWDLDPGLVWPYPFTYMVFLRFSHGFSPHGPTSCCFTGVGKCPILGILDITWKSSHYRLYTSIYLMESNGWVMWKMGTWLMTH